MNNMDLFSYLLGKKSSGGGGDFSEYFQIPYSVRVNREYIGGWADFVVKLPKMEKTFSNCSYLFQGYKGETIDLSGYETDNFANCDNMFAYCYNLKTIDISHFDLSRCGITKSMFNGCGALETLLLPSNFCENSSSVNGGSMFYGCSKLVSAPLFNTSHFGDMSQMFRMCSNLENLPLYNTSNVESMSYMFANCLKLTDTSIDNILQMCINATKYSGEKKLTALSFTASMASASRIQALPHYQDFINAGWTIGY